MRLAAALLALALAPQAWAEECGKSGMIGVYGVRLGDPEDCIEQNFLAMPAPGKLASKAGDDAGEVVWTHGPSEFQLALPGRNIDLERTVTITAKDGVVDRFSSKYLIPIGEEQDTRPCQDAHAALVRYFRFRFGPPGTAMKRVCSDAFCEGERNEVLNYFERGHAKVILASDVISKRLGKCQIEMFVFEEFDTPPLFMGLFEMEGEHGRR